ncbi:STAS domain-containing protein [Novosphingobium sp. SG707]|uniref:STAS domain-containing protein n=1 Tax=Novosphingobium sp. SG707 TaxID=2586996 RepID=UPI00180BC050|nr:STAS domain-containing protein [Novosphingobium sp. SG707]NKJ01146.1 anti-anti-sigma regulatory factor [Novosphingobium sp. SG707]
MMRKIVLPARCDRAAAEALLPEFQAALGAGPLSIDASETRQIGQAMLQLLLSARRTGDGATINPSSALRDAARLTGLENALFEGTMV